MIIRYYQSTPLSAPVVAALWRIGNKYMIADLREEAVGRICKTFPTTLEGWVRIHRNIKEPISNGLDSSTFCEMSHLWSLARVLHEAHLYSALPAIYLEFSYPDLAEMVDASFIDFAEPLSKIVLKAIIGGKEELIRSHGDMVFSWLCKHYIPSPSCNRPDECQLARLVLAQDRFTASVDLQEFGEAEWRDSFTKDLCNVCKADAKQAYDDGSSEYWDHIPVAFGLGTWTELKKRMAKEAGLATQRQ
jgi:hypothetical protein